jgi:hypothetical protein
VEVVAFPSAGQIPPRISMYCIGGGRFADLQRTSSVPKLLRILLPWRSLWFIGSKYKLRHYRLPIR